MFLVMVLGGSCSLCLALIPLLKTLAIHHGLIDRPDGRRKIHARPIPLAGGLAILCSATGTLVLAPLLSEHISAGLVHNHWVCESCGHSFRKAHEFEATAFDEALT